MTTGTDQPCSGSTQSSPVQVLVRLLAGPWLSQALFVAARLGIADLLRDGPRSPEELAATTGTHTRSLRRVLRALAGSGIFAEDADGVFHLTPLSEPLRSDAPNSLRPYAIMMGERWVWRSFGEIEHSVRTGRPAFDKVFGSPVFDYHAAHPDAARVSAEGLASVGRGQDAAVVASYDFSAKTVIDVGGGKGTLLAAILAAALDARGVLLDLPHVIEMARPQFDATGLTGRCDLVPGDFFAAVPAGGDLYMLRKVIHDWSDERALAILRNCRAAMSDTARLLLIELLAPDGNTPSYAKLLDLLMLVYANGQERTEDEHRQLLGKAGFRLARVLPTASAVSVLEAMPA